MCKDYFTDLYAGYVLNLGFILTLDHRLWQSAPSRNKDAFKKDIRRQLSH